MNDDLLIQRYLDGSITSDELQMLQQRLREDAALRAHLRDIAEQAAAFGDMERMRSPFAEPNSESDSTAEDAEIRRGRMPWLALAASIAVLAASAWLFLSSRASPVLTLIESTGNVAWTHGTPIQPGEELTAGTLETVGETSSALFQFGDGSLITLHGESELSFAEECQKVLTLSRGTLSAEVKPQPADRPMLIHTPSATAEVVGTVFDLTARSDDTLLSVDEGMVKLKRLADGSQVDVAANRSAVASLLTDSKLNAASTPEPLTGWSFDFTTQTPPRDWRGFSKDGCMNASAYVARRKPDGSITILHGISVRTSMLEKPVRLLATEHSVIRYRLRVENPVGLNVMLITHEQDGGFGGNFETHISADELHPDADGWCELSIPVIRYRPVDKRDGVRLRHPNAAGNIITSAIINTNSASHRLAVSRFELSAQL